MVGKTQILVELFPDLRPAHHENRAVELDVLPPGQFRMKTGPHLKQARHPLKAVNGE